MAAWLQHIYACALAGRWLLMAVGAVVFPVGVIHGLAIWMGFTP